ncbi:MAG: T9SS type A sorting domain-containing protein [Bacteroidia bacterium]|nr:T9SS type A sorting domain-containing protein [Bacteroidia bacterium]
MKKNLLIFCVSLLIQLGFAQSPSPLVWGCTSQQDSLWAFDTLSWTPVINVPTQGAPFTVDGITGLAFDPTTYKSYAVLRMNGSRYLSEISLPSGSCNVIGDLGDSFSSITFDKFGQLYGATGDGASSPEGFFKIDKATATSTLVFSMGNGADGEVICYNRFDNKIYHWSGNGTMIYESFPVSSTSYTPTNITLNGTTGGETFGALNLTANQFLISNIASEFRYASTTGNYGAGLNSNPDDIRGMIMPPQFASSSTTVCANTGTFSIYSNSLQQFDSVYCYWGDGNFSQVLASNAGTVAHTYTTSGTYTVNVMLFNGAVAKSTIKTYTVTVNTTPIVNITGSTVLCPGATVTLTASGGGNSQWYSSGVAVPNATLNTFTTTTTGWYNMIKTNLSGCSDSAAVGVNVVAGIAPTISAASSTICAGGSAIIVPGGADTYTITGGTFTVNPTSTTSYTVVGSNTMGCVSDPVVSTIMVNALPSLTVNSSNTLICVGESATLSVSGASLYNWGASGSGSAVIVVPTTNTTYTVTGTSAEGCSVTATINQQVSECTGLSKNSVNPESVFVFPNPGSGLFIIENIGQNSEVLIFNGIGQAILNTRSEHNKLQIDLTSFNDGVYFIRINPVQGSSTMTKVIKQ